MSLARQLKNYRLTTAEILYRMPDHPDLLQSFIWQDLDIAPRYPVLHKFLAFWERELDGKLYSVRVASAGLVKPAAFRAPGAFIQIH
ncbi:MAG: usg protein [Alphaproteobacteria bacterium]|nr:usg protein [Alphaproteobacteria bacterium]